MRWAGRGSWESEQSYTAPYQVGYADAPVCQSPSYVSKEYMKKKSLKHPQTHCLRLKRNILHRKLRAIIPNKRLYFSACEAESPLCFSQCGKKRGKLQRSAFCLKSHRWGQEKKKIKKEMPLTDRGGDRERGRAVGSRGSRATLTAQVFFFLSFFFFFVSPHPLHIFRANVCNVPRLIIAVETQDGRHTFKWR